MQLDDGYARYKFALEATGEISMRERNAFLPAHMAVIRRGDKLLEYRSPEYCALTGNSLLPTQLPISDTASGYPFVIVGSASNTIGTAIIWGANIRKATPIFRNTVLSKFEKLVVEWRASRDTISSGTEMFTHPAYQQIIGMGIEAVPLILKEMEANLDHWFWALRAITGKDPVPIAHRGRLKLMASDWLNWARKQGYQW